MTHHPASIPTSLTDEDSAIIHLWRWSVPVPSDSRDAEQIAEHMRYSTPLCKAGAGMLLGEWVDFVNAHYAR